MADNLMGGKDTAGKPRVSLVPMQIVRDIAVIRDYGDKKYGSTDNWRWVDSRKFVDALGRHTLAFLENPLSVDEESGLPHLWHLECNAAFLSEMFKKELQAIANVIANTVTTPVQAENKESATEKPARKGGKPPKYSKGNLPNVSDEALYELYVEKETPAAEIARIYECDVEAVHNRLATSKIVRVPRAKTDEPKYKIESFSSGVLVNTYETDELNKAGIYYDGELKKANGVRLYIDGDRKSIAEAERIFQPYIKKNKNFSLAD